ncbi:MAG TPA: acyltransferase [Stellaceae bacterium]|nr:acyltransferase [Stellaceae bacterium]
MHHVFELDSAHRLLPMEGLRGFAVILVFLQHYTTQNLIVLRPTSLTEDIAKALSSYGNFGVELFFVLSGYLIYRALIRNPNFIPFIKRRAQRIYPAFLVAFGLALVTHLGRVPSGALDAIRYIGENVLLLPGLFPIRPILTVGWSLSYEMFFYVATAVFVVIIARHQWPRWARVAGILTFAASILAFAEHGAPYRMLPFFAGMLLVELGGLSVPGWIALGAPVVAFSLAHVAQLHGALLELTHTAAFFLLCAGCFRDRDIAGSVFRWTPLRWLGNISYSYYLMHAFVVVAMVRIAELVGATAVSNSAFWTLIVPVFALSLLPAAALFVTVEKPFSLQPERRRDVSPILIARSRDPASPRNAFSR